MSSRLLIVATAALLPFTVRAGEMPKQGSETYTNVWVLTSGSMMKVGEGSVQTFTLDGIDTNDEGGLFDKLGGHCLGIYGMVAKKEFARVVCVKTDKDGDQIFEDATSTGGSSGKTVLTGGTGKYAGITGDDDYTFQIIKSPTGTPLFLTTTHVRWKLP